MSERNIAREAREQAERNRLNQIPAGHRPLKGRIDWRALGPHWSGNHSVGPDAVEYLEGRDDLPDGPAERDFEDAESRAYFEQFVAALTACGHTHLGIRVVSEVFFRGRSLSELEREIGISRRVLARERDRMLPDVREFLGGPPTL